MTQFYTMFATPPLMVRRYNGKDFNDIVEYSENCEYIKDESGKYPNPSASSYILKQKVFENFFSFVNDSIDQYVKEVFESDQKLKVTQSWLNNLNPDGQHLFHYHPNSVLSGVFYIKSENNSSPITFINGTKPQYQLSMTGKGNQYNHSSYDFPCVEKILILFPSYINHCVSRNVTSSNRISLSFNTFPDGDLGLERSMTYVSVK